MTDPVDDPRLLSLWAETVFRSRADPRASTTHEPPAAGDRQRFFSALKAEPYAPFCAELARFVDLPEAVMRQLLARTAHADAWTKGVPPVAGFIDFAPGLTLAPLHAGFARLMPGARLPHHEHIDRELTFVLEGCLIDDAQRRYGAGSVIEMPVGSAHSLSVPKDQGALVVLLHGRVRSGGGAP